ncbi:hypothetical protein V6Z11_A01G209300 [Gossypium hirsutum]
MIFQATIFSLKRLEILQIDYYLHGILLLGSRITLSTWLVEMHITLAGLGVIVFLQIQGQSNWSLLLFHKEQEIPSIRRRWRKLLLRLIKLFLLMVWFPSMLILTMALLTEL